MKTSITRPVLRYPGGKFKIAKWIVSHYPQHGLYIEPYSGAASCLMVKAPSEGEVYNDLNEDIVNVFRILRDPKSSKKLQKLLELTPFSYTEYKLAYERVPDKLEMARRVIFRSFASIGSNGVTRKNSGFRGMKNNERPWGSAREWYGYSQIVHTFTERLKNVVIENRPANQLYSIYDREDCLWYLDPPYLMGTRGSHSHLYEIEINHDKNEERTEEEQHVFMADQVKKLKGMVIISGYPSKLYDKLFSDWKMQTKATAAQNGKPRVECIWMSPNIQPRMMF